MKVIILAAGKGSRLGKNYPKILTELTDNKTILDKLLCAITEYVDIKDIALIVGYKKKFITNKYPSLNYITNNNYNSTNTSKSLLLGLENINNDDVIWINGDLVMDKAVFSEIYFANGNCMAVSNNTKLDEEDIKYDVDDLGNIKNVSKTIKNGIGEAFGINKINKKDLELFKNSLEACNDNDYFEKGVEISISNGLIFKPIDIKNKFYSEIDFQKDLNYTINYLKEQ